MFGHIYEGRRVFVTGHTGFKGSWLTAWLLQMGAEVAGFSDAVPTGPSHFDVIGLGGRIRDCRGDVRDRKALVEAMREFQAGDRLSFGGTGTCARFLRQPRRHHRSQRDGHAQRAGSRARDAFG